MKALWLTGLGLIVLSCGSKDSDDENTDMAPSVVTPETKPVSKTLDPEIEAGIAYYKSGKGVGQYSSKLIAFLDLDSPKVDADQAITDFLSPEPGAEGNQTFKSKVFGSNRAEHFKYYLAKNMADDSVKDMEIVASWIAGPTDAHRFSGAMARIRCWRGENTTEWQIDPCP